jgi:hypothetical protein
MSQEQEEKQAPSVKAALRAVRKARAQVDAIAAEIAAGRGAHHIVNDMFGLVAELEQARHAAQETVQRQVEFFAEQVKQRRPAPGIDAPSPE